MPTNRDRADEYVEAVLLLVEQVPSGSATTYGAIAEVVARHLGRGGPRTVGRVLALNGQGVPWWRTVRADGSLAPALARRARAEYLREGTPLRSDGRVHLSAAWWQPPDHCSDLRKQ